MIEYVVKRMRIYDQRSAALLVELDSRVAAAVCEIAHDLNADQGHYYSKLADCVIAVKWERQKKTRGKR